MNCLRILGGGLFAVVIATGALAQSRSEELMRKSGLWDQAAQMRLQMKAGVAQARAEAKAAGQTMLSE